MQDRLQDLRQMCAKPLQRCDAAEMQQHARQIADWLVQHFATLPEQSVGQVAGRAEMEALLREAAPETSTPFSDVFAEFRDKVCPYAMRVNHPRFLAFVPSAPSFVSVLGDWLCAGTNFFAGVWKEAAGPAQVEIVVLDWFKQLLGFPAEARGILTAGGSEANLTALVVARDRLALADRSRAVLYVSEHRHYSIDRAVKVMGFAPQQVRVIPADENFGMNAGVFINQVRRDREAGQLPWLIFATAGTTNTGAVDPLAALADFCRADKLWLHVDAAYGWPAVLTDEGRERFAGIERADSVTLDPHKWFGQTFEAGCVLVRDGRLLHEAFATAPEYMQDVAAAADEINFCDHGLALTRRFRALKIWLSVKVLGLGWFRELVTHCCRLAELAELLLHKAGFEILSGQRLSIVCFRAVPANLCSDAAIDEFNRQLCERARSTGEMFLSTTRLRGRTALRLCFINWRTTTRDVEDVVKLLTELSRHCA